MTPSWGSKSSWGSKFLGLFFLGLQAQCSGSSCLPKEVERMVQRVLEALMPLGVFGRSHPKSTWMLCSHAQWSR